MAAIFAMPDDEFFFADAGEPSEYERMLEEKRQERLLKQQIKQYGDDAMRFEPTMAVDSSTMPTEEFQRSYQLRMPGVKHAKPKEKDPLASLLKAMKLGQSTGTKNNRATGNENKHDGVGPEGSDAVEKSTEKLTLYAR